MLLSRAVEKRRPARTFDPADEHERAARVRGPLEAISTFERALITRWVSLPAGGSLLAVARRA
jgi:hypothetical protein